MLTGLELDHLIRTLEREGLTVSVSQRAELYDLCVIEAARLRNADRLAVAPFFLAPVICERALDQSRFHEVYGTWRQNIDTLSRPPGESTGESSTSAQARADRPLPSPIVWIFGCLAFVLSLAVLLTLFDPTARQRLATDDRRQPRSMLAVKPQEADSAQALQERTGLGSLRLLGLFVPLVIFAFWLHWRSTRRRAVSRRWNPQSTTDLNWLPTRRSDFRSVLDPRLVRQCTRFKVWEETSGPTRLDINESVEATAAAGGRVVLVANTVSAPREYVALVQCHGPDDHAAQVARSLLSVLQDYEVQVHIFEFGHRPEQVKPLAPDSSSLVGMPADELDLGLVRKRHPTSPILVFGDCELFYDPESGAFEPWITLLTETRRCVALSYRPPRDWAGPEYGLETTGISVLPLTMSGLVSVPRLLEPGRPQQPVRSPQRAASLNPATSNSAVRASGRSNLDEGTEVGSSPDPAVSVTRLAERLDPEAFYWLAACAVYPHLRWELTIGLGLALRPEPGRPLFTEARLGDLISLPWFRQAAIPDPVRLVLIERLTPRQRRRVRAVVQEMLMDALAEPFRASGSPLPADNPECLTRPDQQRQLDDYLDTRRPESPMRDPLFTRILLGRGPRQLALQWSDRLARLLGIRVDLIPLLGALLALLGVFAMHLISNALEQWLPGLSDWLRGHHVVVLVTIYVSFILSWCAFWTAVVVNSRFVVHLDEYRRPRMH